MLVRDLVRRKIEATHLWVLSAVVGAVSLIACSDGGLAELGVKEVPARTLSSSSTVADLTFDLVYPAGSGLTKAVAGASNTLTVGSGVRVFNVDGTPGAIANSGSQGGVGLTLGASAQVGDLVSVPAVNMGAGASAGSVRTSATVTRGANVHTTSVLEHATLIPSVVRTVSVHPPSGPHTAVTVAAGSTSTLTPADYATVTVGANATLALSSGTYLLDNFTVGSGARVRLDTEDGTVNLYVRNGVTWNGQVVGDGTRFVLGVLGSGGATMQGSFSGTVLIPSGALTLGANGTYQGAFYAKTLNVGANATLRKSATPFLIDGISLSKTTACVGEQIEATLAGATTAPGAITSINRTAGAHQFVQFSGPPGVRRLWAIVRTPDGIADFIDVPVTLTKCTPSAGTLSPVALHYAGSQLGGTDRVEFSVRAYDSNGHEIPPAGPASYTWTFGDGHTQITSDPIVDHDYAAATSPLAQYNYFNASVTMTTSMGSTTAQRVVALWNLYALNRAKGVIQAPMQLAINKGKYTATITNRETSPLQMSSTRVDLAPCDPADRLQPQAVQSIAAAIPASGSAVVNIPPPVDVPPSICGLNVHIFGSTAAGDVYASSYVTVRENPFLRHPVTDAATIAYLNQASSLASNPNSFDQLEIARLVAVGKLPEFPARAPASGVYSAPSLGADCTPGDISALGLECQPSADEWLGVEPVVLNGDRGDIMMEHGCGDIGKLIHAIGQTFSHEAMFVTRGVEVRHSTAASDYVQQGLNPAAMQIDDAHERYVFPGTSNLDTYTISQISGEYFLKNPDGGDDIRFGTELSLSPSVCHDEDFAAIPPVVVRPPPNADSSISLALARMTERGGEICSTDADCQSGSCDTANAKPGVPAMCKPGSMFAINGHYRFDMYSNAQTPLPGPASGYGFDTISTVSSTFMHLIPFRAGLPLRKSLSLTANVTDGMRQYDQTTRLAGANELYDDYYNHVKEACRPADGGGAVLGGFLGAVLGGGLEFIVAPALAGGLSGEEYCEFLANNIANQTDNCFASDRCDDLSIDWRAPGSGVTVSPDDILLWDLPNPVDKTDPSKGLLGMYGYNEPLAYAPAVYRRRYKWVAHQGSSFVQVKVLDGKASSFIDGKPQPFTGANGAWVSLNGVHMGNTDSSGFAPNPLHFYTVSSGKYDVSAQWSACGNFGPPPAGPPPPMSVDPYTLPQCTDANRSQGLCQHADSCPGIDDYNTVDCVPDCFITCSLVCACQPYQPPTCSTVLETASKPLVIPSGAAKTVELLLCEGVVQTDFNQCTDDSKCASGLQCNPSTHLCEDPDGCVQSCADADGNSDDSQCFSTLMCVDGYCRPRPLNQAGVDGVSIQLSYRVPFVNDDDDDPQISVFKEPVHCDPDLVDADHPDANPGQTVTSVTCIQAFGEDVATLTLTSTCSRSLNSSDGKIFFDSTIGLDEGCGKNLTAHPLTHHEWGDALAPIPDQHDTDSFEMCYGGSGGCSSDSQDIVVDAQIDFATVPKQ